MLIGRKIVTEEDRAKALAKAREKQRKRIPGKKLPFGLTDRKTAAK